MTATDTRLLGVLRELIGTDSDVTAFLPLSGVVTCLVRVSSICPLFAAVSPMMVASRQPTSGALPHHASASGSHGAPPSAFNASRTQDRPPRRKSFLFGLFSSSSASEKPRPQRASTGAKLTKARSSSPAKQQPVLRNLSPDLLNGLMTVSQLHAPVHLPALIQILRSARIRALTSTTSANTPPYAGADPSSCRDHL